MQEFSEMVLRLNGREMTDSFDLVFAKSDGERLTLHCFHCFGARSAALSWCIALLVNNPAFERHTWLQIDHYNLGRCFAHSFQCICGACKRDTCVLFEAT